jgi:hypothetical protein
MDAVTGDEHDRHLALDMQEYVYGTLTVLVAVGGLSGSSTLAEPGEAIAVIVGVAIATALAHVFSALTGLHVATRRPLRRTEALRELGHSWRVVTACGPAVVVFLLAALGWYSTRTALRLTTLLGVLTLMAIGVLASRRAGAKPFSTVVFVVMATLIGLAIVAIELYVHHL